MPEATSSGRRTHRERTEATTAGLIKAARDLFAKDGYGATSLDAVVAAAGVTKGALYHHFAGKKELFQAVFEAEQRALVARISAAYGRREDSWVAFEAGVREFMDACLDPEIQQIVLIDAPGALGWGRMRAIEAEGTLALLKVGLERAISDGRVERRPVDPLAHLLFGAICEGVMSVARAQNQETAARSMRAELRRLLNALEVGEA